MAEEAQADLAERAGRHCLCHSHLWGRGVRRAAHPPNLLLRQSARLAGRERSQWPHGWRASPLMSVPAPGITDTPPCREGLGGWGYPEAPSLLTRDAPEPCGGQLASVLSRLSPTELHTECPHPPRFPSPAVPPLGGHMAPPFCLGQWHPMTQSSTAPGLGWGAPGTWWISSGTYGVGCFSSPIQEIKIHIQRKISRDARSSSQGPRVATTKSGSYAQSRQEGQAWAPTKHLHPQDQAIAKEKPNPAPPEILQPQDPQG